MTRVHKFRCFMVSGDPLDQNQKNEAIIGSVSLPLESGKKSSFLYDSSSSSSSSSSSKEDIDNPAIPKPSHLIIEYDDHDHDHDHDDKGTSSLSSSSPSYYSSSSSNRNLQTTFFLGGFQIVSNAKQCEVYVTTAATNDGGGGGGGKEEYLMTSRGIPFEKGKTVEEWQKAVCVVPGGPRPITRLRIKLLSLKPSGDDICALLKSLKLTARVPDAPAPSQSPSQSPSITSQQQQQQQPTGSTPLPSMTSIPNNHHGPRPPKASSSTTPGLTQGDMGVAMAGLSMMARTTQDEIEQTVSTKLAELQTFLDFRWTKMEQHVFSLTSVVLSHKTALEEKNKLLQLQQDMIQSQQAEQTKMILEQQREFNAMVQSLQTELSNLRPGLAEKDELLQRQQQDMRQSQQAEQTKVILEQQREFSSMVKNLQTEISELRLEKISRQPKNETTITASPKRQLEQQRKEDQTEEKPVESTAKDIGRNDGEQNQSVDSRGNAEQTNASPKSQSEQQLTKDKVGQPVELSNENVEKNNEEQSQSVDQQKNAEQNKSRTVNSQDKEDNVFVPLLLRDNGEMTNKGPVEIDNEERNAREEEKAKPAQYPAPPDAFGDPDPGFIIEKIEVSLVEDEVSLIDYTDGQDYQVEADSQYASSAVTEDEVLPAERDATDSRLLANASGAQANGDNAVLEETEEVATGDKIEIELVAGHAGEGQDYQVKADNDDGNKPTPDIEVLSKTDATDQPTRDNEVSSKKSTTDLHLQAKTDEQRNDDYLEDEREEVMSAGTIEIELLDGNAEFDACDVMEQEGNDANERNPPEVAEGDLLGL